jgi:hypothetical protein
MAITIDICGLHCDINRTRCVVAPRSGKGRHLTVYFLPQEKGRWKGFWTPHVTIPRQARQFILRATETQVRRWGEKLGMELAHIYFERVRRVEPSQLDPESWGVYLPLEEEDLLRVAESARVGKKSYRVDEQSFVALSESMAERLCVPAVLSDPDFPKDRPAFGIGPDRDGAPDPYMFCYQDEGRLGPAGWYAVRLPLLGPDMIEQLVERNFGKNGLAKLQWLDKVLNPT